MKIDSSLSDIYTIGHSTRSIEEFIAVLKANQIQLLADVRTTPGSAHVPQFNQESLSFSLKSSGIEYIHLKNLGGRRKALKHSINMGWRNASFRGYADYMQTAEFEQALTELISISEKRRTCIMCAEAVPWRCHRSLIGDALIVLGIQVIDIFTISHHEIHKITAFAKVNNSAITYPADIRG